MRPDNPDTRTENDIRDRVELIFENYTLEELLEMNDLTEKEVIFLMFMEGHISEPQAYFP